MAEKLRADAAGPFKEFVLTKWLRDGVEGACNRVKHSREQFEPANFRRHLHNAQKEQLLAMRSMIDRALNRLEKTEEETEA